MPDTDPQKLGDQQKDIPPAPRHATVSSHGLSVVRVALEVVLISVGVFLGLMGDEWRERAQHRELAEASLRRFRAEFRTNRNAVASVKDKHIAKLNDLRAYFAADPGTRRKLPVPNTGLSPAFFEYTAWDLAQATQSLAYIDPDLAFSISHVYAAQRQLDELTRAITQSMYSRPDLNTFLLGVSTYFGDCTLHEPRLLTIYDEILPRLDRALGDVPAGASK
jgi:hypothetical protein